MRSRGDPRRAFALPASPERIDADLQDEFRFHIEERIEQFMGEGMSRAQAEREVARRFGDYELHRALTKQIDQDTMHIRRRSERLRDIQREVRLAVRSLRRSPGFTAVAFCTLALGIAAATGIFSVLDTVVLRPLPYPDAQQLVSVLHPATVPGNGERTWGVSPGGYFQFAESKRSFSSFGIYRNGGLTVTNDRQAELAQMSMVSASMFTVLQARATAGRLFTLDDERPDAPLVAVLSAEFFERRFGSNPAMIGKNLETSYGLIPIVGIAQPGLTLPMPGPFASSADLAGFGVDIWLPMHLNPNGPFYNNHPNVGVGRLRDGVTIAEAQAEIDLKFSRFTELMPNAYSKGFLKSYNFRVKVEALQQTVLGPRLPRTLWMLFGAVMLVLGIATANVANLYLVRLDVRRRESAVRAALGADRGQMATHHLSETLLLCVSAAIAGIGLAAAGLRALIIIAPTDIPRLATVALDGRAVALALALAITLAVLLGILPLMRSRLDIDALRSGSRGQSASSRQRAARNVLVVGQLAMALTLLAAAGLMLRSFAELRDVSPGFSSENVLAFDLSLPYSEYPKRSSAIAFHSELQRRIRALPGVVDMASTSNVPLEGFGTGCSVVYREKEPYGPGEPTPCVIAQVATPGLFTTLRIPVAGRVPTWGDVTSRTQAVVVTQALANRLWPNQSPIGKGIGSNGATAERWYRVVGVASDFKGEALDAPHSEAVFYSTSGLREDDENGDLNDHAFLVRTANTDPMSLLPSIRRVVSELNPRIPIVTPRTMDAVVARSMARTTFLMVLLGTAAIIALVLSAVGLYGVISYIVTQRRAEIGIRMALGASVAQVVRLVMLQSVRLAVTGIAVGLLGALAIARLMQAVLFGVKPADPLVMTSVVIVLLVTTLVATIVPARRAARVDPSEAMRTD